MTEQFLCFVYGLRFRKVGHPADGKIRYVGKTLHPARRFRQHMKAINPSRSRLARSVRKHGAACFSFEVLAQFSAETKRQAEVLALAEEVRLIADFDTANGSHGLNLTIGGEGVSAVGEAKERHREASRAALNETKRRPEVQAILRAQAKARFDDPVYRENIQGRGAVARRAETMRAKHRQGRSRVAFPGRETSWKPAS